MQTTLISEDQLTELIESVWSTLLDLHISLPDDDQDVPAWEGLTCSVVIRGAFHGTVLWLPTERFAKWAAARMLAIPESSLAASDVEDAMAELCNIVGGAAKGLLPGPSSLSMPRVTRGSRFTDEPSCSEVACKLMFNCEQERLEVRIEQDDGPESRQI
jgi:chemotaxis protein CheX